MVWLLVAVALFASLSYVVAENMRSGNPEVMAQELAKNHATEILQFSSAIRRAVQTLKIDGIEDTELSFENNILTGYANADCTSEYCKVFSLNGGGVNYSKPNPQWLDASHEAKDHYGGWLITGTACISGVGSGGDDCEADGDTGSEELLLIMPYIRQNICEELNKKLDLNNPSGAPLQEGAGAWHATPAIARFTGDYLDSAEIGDSAAIYKNTRSGCFEGSGANTPPAGTYHYYLVLLAR